MEVTGADGSRDLAQGDSFHTGLPQWTAQWVEPDWVRKPLTDKTTPTHGVIAQKNPEEILDSAVSLRKSFHLDALPERTCGWSSYPMCRCPTSFPASPPTAL